MNFTVAIIDLVIAISAATFGFVVGVIVTTRMERRRCDAIRAIDRMTAGLSK